MSERQDWSRARRSDVASGLEGVEKRGQPVARERGRYGNWLVWNANAGRDRQARGGPGHGPEEESPDKTLSLEELRQDATRRSQEDDRGQDRPWPGARRFGEITHPSPLFKESDDDPQYYMRQCFEHCYVWPTG